MLNNYACGDRKCKKIFYVNTKSNLSSFYKLNEKSKFHTKKNTNNNVKKIEVNQITLSEYIKKLKIQNIDLLKIDTQRNDDYIL